MTLALILDLEYVHPAAKESVAQYVQKVLNPCLRLIKQFNSARFSIYLPLNTLEILENFGYVSVINEFKDLLQQEKIELLGGFAYCFPSTIDIPDYAANQAILNEYGLAYYFGKHQGFEGDNELLLKDVTTFYLKSNVTSDVVTAVASLNYKYFLTPSPNDTKPGIYTLSLEDTSKKVILAASTTALEGALLFTSEDLGFTNETGLDYIAHLYEKYRTTINCVPVSELSRYQPVGETLNVTNLVGTLPSIEPVSAASDLFTLLQRDIMSKVHLTSISDALIEKYFNLKSWDTSSILKNVTEPHLIRYLCVSAVAFKLFSLFNQYPKEKVDATLSQVLPLVSAYNAS